MNIQLTTGGLLILPQKCGVWTVLEMYFVSEACGRVLWPQKQLWALKAQESLELHGEEPFLWAHVHSL